MGKTFVDPTAGQRAAPDARVTNPAGEEKPSGPAEGDPGTEANREAPRDEVPPSDKTHSRHRRTLRSLRRRRNAKNA